MSKSGSGDKAMIEKMKALLREHDLCVLATAAGQRPHCSLMAYVADQDCRRIYMMTGTDSTKYANLTANPAVSLLVDTRVEDAAGPRSRIRALTASGRFVKLTDPDQRRAVRARLLEKHPHLKDLARQPGIEVFAIRIESLLLLLGPSEAHFARIE